MLSNLLGKITLFAMLFNIDRELAIRQRESGCPRCGGPLHEGGYDRKPRGELCGIPEAYRRRHSLCCGWCRRRCLPPSVLFWGQRVYWSPAFVLVTASRQGKPDLSYAYLRQLLGVSARTVRRWLSYFAQVFPYQARWIERRGYVQAEVPNDQLPSALLRSFGRAMPAEESLVAMLRFLAV